LPTARVLPSGEKARHDPRRLPPGKLTGLSATASQSDRELVSVAVARSLPSGEKATQRNPENSRLRREPRRARAAAGRESPKESVRGGCTAAGGGFSAGEAGATLGRTNARTGTHHRTINSLLAGGAKVVWRNRLLAP